MKSDRKSSPLPRINNCIICWCSSCLHSILSSVFVYVSQLLWYNESNERESARNRNRDWEGGRKIHIDYCIFTYTSELLIFTKSQLMSQYLKKNGVVESFKFKKIDKLENAGTLPMSRNVLRMADAERQKSFNGLIYTMLTLNLFFFLFLSCLLLPEAHPCSHSRALSCALSLRISKTALHTILVSSFYASVQIEVKGACMYTNHGACKCDKPHKVIT